MTYPCERCGGTGTIRGFSHVLGGVCFKCGGSGRLPGQAPRRSEKWAVHLPAIVPAPSNGETHVYIRQGRTPAEAIRAAARVFARAPKIQAEYTMEGAWTEPYAEYERRWNAEHPYTPSEDP